MLIVTRDESPLVYRTPDASGGSNFECSTAPFYNCLARLAVARERTSNANAHAKREIYIYMGGGGEIEREKWREKKEGD